MKKIWKFHKIPVLIILFSIGFACLPIVASLLSIILAELNNCTLSAGSLSPCFLVGKDISKTLYIMFLSHWYAFFTVPIGFLGVILGVIILVIQVIVNSKKQSSSNNQE
jgi:hypothetical protein